MEDTARREVLEEAGVHGRIICSAGYLSFGFDEHTEMFLMEFESLADTPAERECVWLEMGEALATLSFDNSRDLLRSADSIAGSVQ